MNCRSVLLAALLAGMGGINSLHAQSDHLVSFDTGRTAGGTPVQMRAILIKPAAVTDTAVLFFRGVPGYARIQTVADRNRNLIAFMRASLPLFLEAGLALVIMDCPTDQWGAPGDVLPSACMDDYRSSHAHAEDVRGVMARLRAEHGITRFFLMGHSQGTMSSRWLALNLGGDIAGSVHSASVNIPNPKGQYASVRNFPYERIATPMLHVHHEQDACRGTPYAIVKGYAGSRLTTVRGGTPQGDPCGGQHLHSYMGMEVPVGRAIVQWMKSGSVQTLVE
jgi:hypothetical protein